MSDATTNEELAVRWQVERRPEDIAALTANNLGLIYKYVRQYKRRSVTVTYEDLIQEAMMSVRSAADKFDPAHGKFSTYLVWWVRAACIAYYRHLRAVTIPPQSARRRELGELFMHDWSTTDAATGETLDLIDGSVDSTEVELLQREEALAARDVVSRFRVTLGARDRVILAEMLAGSKTLVEVGGDLGISRERVRQLNERLADDLREFVKASRAVQDRFVARQLQAARKAKQRRTRWANA